MAFPGCVFRVYNHVIPAWIARTPDCNLLFRVTATQANGSQMAAVVDATGQFLNGVLLQDEPDLASVPYQPGAVMGYAQLMALLQAGTGSGQGLSASVGSDRRVLISRLSVLG